MFTAISAFLAPYKAYFYGAVLAAVLGVFGWYTYHERSVEHVKDVAAEVKQVNKANAQVQAETATASATETQNAIIWEKAVAIPAVGDLGIVCERTPGSVPLPQAGGVTGAPAGVDAPNGGVEARYDPSGAALAVGHAADAQIKYLQRRVAELEAQMNGSP